MATNSATTKSQGKQFAAAATAAVAAAAGAVAKPAITGANAKYFSKAEIAGLFKTPTKSAKAAKAAVAAYPGVAESGPGIDVPGTWWLGSRNTELLVLGKKLVVIDNTNLSVFVCAPTFEIESESISICAHNTTDDALLNLCGDSVAIEAELHNLDIGAAENLNIFATGGQLQVGTTAGTAAVFGSAAGPVGVVAVGNTLSLLGAGGVNVNNHPLVAPAYAHYYANPADNAATIVPDAKFKFPQTAVQAVIVPNATADSFELPEIGIYDITWCLHVSSSPVPVSQAASAIYLDAGGINGSIGTTPENPPAVNEAVPWSIVGLDIDSPNSGDPNEPVQLIGHAIILTTAASTKISIRNAGTNDYMVGQTAGGAAPRNTLTIRRIDYL